MLLVIAAEKRIRERYYGMEYNINININILYRQHTEKSNSAGASKKKKKKKSDWGYNPFATSLIMMWGSCVWVPHHCK